jgi:DNA-binding transcriptional ArsR family regulator
MALSSDYSKTSYRRRNPLPVKSDTGINIDLVKALAHPARFHALDILNKRVASPKELAAEVGIEVGLMSYHVTALKKKGFIELVDTAQRRGATEHYYRATKRALFSDEEWPKVPANMRESIVGEQVERTWSGGGGGGRRGGGGGGARAGARIGELRRAPGSPPQSLRVAGGRAGLGGLDGGARRCP